MTTILDPETSASLGAALRERRAQRRAPAISAAVARGGQLAWSDALGVAAPGAPATPATAFRVGSISKPMTAVAVLRLAAEGRLALAERIGRHLPDAPASDATVAQLLTHTAGLPAEPAGPWWERHGGCTWDDLVAMDLPSLWEPGERFHYSNVGYAVLGRLVEELSGRPWDDVLRTDLWEPLGMHATGRVPHGSRAAGYAVHPHADRVLAEPVPDYLALGPAGEVWSTPSDLVRFGSWLVGAADTSAEVLPVAWRRRMTTPRVVVDVPGAPFTTAWGLGVSVKHDAAGEGRRTVGHGGSVPGFTADLQVDVATGDAAALCGSSTAGTGDSRFLLELAGAGAAAGLPDDARGPTPVATASRSAGALALTGTWYWGPTPFTITVDAADRLELRAAEPGGRATVFARARSAGGSGTPDRDGRAEEWIGVEGGYWLGERLRAVPDLRDEAGPPVALDVGTFVLTRTPYDPAATVPGGLDAVGWQAPPVG